MLDSRRPTTRRAVDYLVGGLRISLEKTSTTPGPTSHITHFSDALSRLGLDVKIYVASSFPGLGRFARMREGSTRDAGKPRLFLSDLVRLAASFWSGCNVFTRSLGRQPDIIYERAAVMQSLTSFHPQKSKAVRIVECNGIMSLETAKDRNALALTKLAERIERHVYRSADIVIAVSEALADTVGSFASIPREKILVVPNAIPPELLSIRLVETPKNIVGFVGSVVKWQQIDTLIEALSLPESGSWTAEIIGDGPELEHLKSQAARLGIRERVTFLGRLTQGQAFERMSRWTAGYAGHVESAGHAMYHSPLKLYEYAGLGLVAFSSPSEDATRLSIDGMKLWQFTNTSELANALASASNQPRTSHEREQSRIHLSVAHSWTARAESVLERVGLFLTHGSGTVRDRAPHSPRHH